MKIQVTLMVVLFSTTIFALQQTDDSVLSVTTQQESVPVLLSGTVAKTPQKQSHYSYEGVVSATNITSKPIVLVIATIKLVVHDTAGSDTATDVAERSLTRIDDYFFRPHVLDPGVKTSWDISLDSMPAVSATPRIVKRSAVGTIDFVQFADGSTWGNKSTAEGALNDRQRALEKLNGLVDSYKIEGQAQFSTELMNSSDLPIILYLQLMYRSSNDANSVLEKIKTLLQYASVRDK